MNHSRKLAYWVVMLLGCYGMVTVFRLEDAFPAIAALPGAGFVGGLLSGIFLFGLPTLAAPVFRPGDHAAGTVFGVAARAPRVYFALSVASAVVMTGWGTWALVAEFVLPSATTPTLAVAAAAATVLAAALVTHVARTRATEPTTRTAPDPV